MKKYIQLEIPFDIEVWRPVVGYEDLYEVSNLGRVKSLHYQKKYQKILYPQTHKDGYKVINLYNGAYKRCSIHRLVALAFIPNPKNLPCIDHINTIRDDNRVCNIRWCTQKTNTNNPLTLKKRKNTYQSVSEKLSKPVKLINIKNENVFYFSSLKEAANKLNLNYTNISHCLRGDRKSVGGYKVLYN